MNYVIVFELQIALITNITNVLVIIMKDYIGLRQMKIINLMNVKKLIV